MNKLKYIWQKLNSTFWFIPIMLVIVSVIFAFLFIYIDYELQLKPYGILKYIYAGSADSARSILSTIAGAMIGVAGTVFSITLVALTLASSQFGSRLLRNFMYDTVNQTVLGSFVATFIFCLLVLNSVRGGEVFQFIPVLSVFVSIALGIMNIILLIIFIHHIATTIQSDKIISDISNGLFNQLDELTEEDGDNNKIRHNPNMEFIRENYKYEYDIHSLNNGYVQYIDFTELLEIAIDREIVIITNYRAGQYIINGSQLFKVLSNEKFDDKLNEKLNDIVSIGEIRTALQDIEFAVHQIVEIAVRALSPGVNDPYTANSCIDNLSAIISKLTNTPLPNKNRYDEKGNLRLIINILTFEGMIDAAYNQIRQYAATSPSVLIRMMDAINSIYTFAINDSQREVIHKHADMIHRTAIENIKEKNDLADLERRYKF